MAVEAVLGGEMVWYSEFERHPSKLLEQRFPGVPNHGDLTKIDWNTVEPIDILTGGYPCQPFSWAGKRNGEDDPRHLWPYIREAIRVLRPRITILENVAGHRSKGFATVLRDCAEDGFDVWWVSVRASDAGAPHRRERLFFAVSSDTFGSGPQRDHPRSGGYDPVDKRRRETFPDTYLGRRERCDSDTIQAATNTPHEGCTGVREARGWGTGPAHNTGVDWGEYEPAIRRWERVLGRPAPSPTEPNKNGRPRLTARFVEWMMGLPDGWVTGIDIPYGAKIKLLGNGVVPQQAELAIRHLLDLTSHIQEAS